MTWSNPRDQQGSHNERHTTQTLQPGARRKPPSAPAGIVPILGQEHRDGMEIA
jgi:hypothetical protein